MFSVQLEDIKYQIRFKYNKDSKKEKERNNVTCFITAKDMADKYIKGPYKIKVGTVEFFAVSKGVARLHPNDYFNRHVGLKVALKNALNKCGFNKVERSIIWERYFEKVNYKYQ